MGTIKKCGRIIRGICRGKTMKKNAKEHFARCAIEDVFSDDPEYLCNRLFEGSWSKMYDYLTINMKDCTSIQFPDPDWTDIATDWTEEDYDENRIFMGEEWEHGRMSDALKIAWEEEYYAVRHALKCGITLEDLE